MRKRVLLAVVAAAATGLTVAPLTASASSHREAPLIAEDPLGFNNTTKSYTNWNRPQTYSITMTNVDTGSSAVIGSNLLTPPDVVGDRSTGSAQNYHMLAKKAEYALPGGFKVFAGQRDDPFFANLGGVFDLLNFSGATTGAEDYLAGMNAHSIVLSVPS